MPNVIAFPYMHPELAGLTALAGVLTLDPGLAKSPAPGTFRPPDYPLIPAQAADALRQASALGGGFTDPKDLASFAAADFSGQAPGSSLDIRLELERRADPDLAAKQAKAALTRAQVVIGLAYRLEETSIELLGLDERIHGSYARLTKEIGLAREWQKVDYENCGCGGDEDDDDTSHGAGGIDYENCPSGEDEEEYALESPGLADPVEAPPWRVLLASVLAFLPGDFALITKDAGIAASWDEFGAALAPASADIVKAHLPGVPDLSGLRCGRAPGYALCLSRRPDPEKPWLTAPRIVFHLPQGGRP